MQVKNLASSLLKLQKMNDLPIIVLNSLFKRQMASSEFSKLSFEIAENDVPLIVLNSLFKRQMASSECTGTVSVRY